MDPAEWDRARSREDLVDELNQESAAARFRWRLGRRGAFLVTMGALFVALGYGYGYEPVPPTVTAQLAMPLSIIPDLTVWGTFWMISGAVAIFNAWWPPGKDAFGFIALEGFAAAWGVLNILGAILLGAPRAWVTGGIFLVYAISVLIVSGMPDPTPIMRAQEAREERQEE